MIKTKKIYDPESAGKGFRVFIDRLWPRGISKEKARWKEWLKEIAPRDELRKWFNLDILKVAKFHSLSCPAINMRN
jgi:uncharacterized protein YeaO (DUF488 family)